MFHRILTASFKNIIKTDQICFHISVRIRNRITHTCLCRQIHHNLRCIFFKKIRNESFIGNIPF